MPVQRSKYFKIMPSLQIIEIMVAFKPRNFSSSLARAVFSLKEDLTEHEMVNKQSSVSQHLCMCVFVCQCILISVFNAACLRFDFSFLIVLSHYFGCI